MRLFAGDHICCGAPLPLLTARGFCLFVSGVLMRICNCPIKLVDCYLTAVVLFFIIQELSDILKYCWIEYLSALCSVWEDEI